MHEFDVLWKNAFRHVLTVAGVKVLELSTTTVTLCHYLITGPPTLM